VPPVEPQGPSRAKVEKQCKINIMQLSLEKCDFFQSLYRNSRLTNKKLDFFEKVGILGASIRVYPF